MIETSDPETSPELNPSAGFGKWRRIVERWRALSTKWRRAITLASIGALLGVLLQFTTLVEKVINLMSPHLASHTKVEMMSATEDTIFVNVSNDGGRPSTLLDYRLDFGTLPIEKRTLRLVDDDRSKTSIPGYGHVPIRLTVLGLRTRVRDDGQPGRFGKADIDQLMNGQEVTLEVDVRESNDPSPRHWWKLTKPRKFHTTTDEFSVERIREFVLYWLPAHDVH